MNVRPPRRDDLDVVLALMRAHDTAAWGGSDWTRAGLEEHWGGIDLAHDAWVVELDGRLAGYVDFKALPQGRLLADGYAAPDVLVPDGIEIRPYRPGEERAIHAAFEEARSVGGWLHSPRPFEDFERRNFGRAGHDPSLYLVAADADGIAGVALCDSKRNGEWGWVDTLGVRPAWRRRGIGEALLRRAFRAFVERGERTVALQVDAQSPTGAKRLYKRAGMRVLYRIVVWEKILRDD